MSLLAMSDAALSRSAKRITDLEKRITELESNAKKSETVLKAFKALSEAETEEEISKRRVRALMQGLAWSRGQEPYNFGDES